MKVAATAVIAVTECDRSGFDGILTKRKQKLFCQFHFAHLLSFDSCCTFNAEPVSICGCGCGPVLLDWGF